MPVRHSLPLEAPWPGQASNDHSDLSRQGRVPLNWQTSDRLSNLPYTRKLFSLEENSI